MSKASTRRSGEAASPGHGGVASSFEQAQTPVEGSQNVPIVAKRSGHKLTRVAFKVSRLMEFCSEKELVNQTGHEVEVWSLVLVKELFDNALDACEEDEVAPEIEIIIGGDGTVTIIDNAGGFATETIKAILDYSIRVSKREAYVSPTRGAQGNALKSILAMGYVLDRQNDYDESINDEAVGVTTIETRGQSHRIEFKVDHVNNQPKLTHTITPGRRTRGTAVIVKWPRPRQRHRRDWVAAQEANIKLLVEHYAWRNPHLTLRGVWRGKTFIDVKATNPNWVKWRPRDPTSPHWYNASRLQRYMAAHVAHDRELRRDGTVRDFIAEFRGLARTSVRKQILAEIGCSHQSLAEFFGSERVNRRGIAALLRAMRKYSKPVQPKHLGVIGREHFQQRFLAAGGNIETFTYKVENSFEKGVPFVVEIAFGLHQSGLKPKGGKSVSRKIVIGVNWSVAINNPFRVFGRTGEGLESKLEALRVNAREPVICAVHLASAHVQYADRGKSAIVLSDDDVEPSDE